MEDVLQRVREAANWTAPIRTAAAGPADFSAPHFKMAYAAEGKIEDPYAGLAPRIVPENITFLPKTAKQATGGNNWNERTITVKKGETLDSVLTEFGATPEEIKAIVKTLGSRGGTLKEGLKLRMTENALKFLIDKGYDEKFGARPLRRAIQRFIEDPLSEKILGSEFARGDELEVEVSADGQTLEFKALSTKT